MQKKIQLRRKKDGKPVFPITDTNSVIDIDGKPLARRNEMVDSTLQGHGSRIRALEQRVPSVSKTWQKVDITYDELIATMETSKLEYGVLYHISDYKPMTCQYATYIDTAKLILPLYVYAASRSNLAPYGYLGDDFRYMVRYEPYYKSDSYVKDVPICIDTSHPMIKRYFDLSYTHFIPLTQDDYRSEEVNSFFGSVKYTFYCIPPDQRSYYPLVVTDTPYPIWGDDCYIVGYDDSEGEISVVYESSITYVTSFKGYISECIDLLHNNRSNFDFVHIRFECEHNGGRFDASMFDDDCQNCTVINPSNNEIQRCSLSKCKSVSISGECLAYLVRCERCIIYNRLDNCYLYGCKDCILYHVWLSTIYFIQFCIVYNCIYSDINGMQTETIYYSKFNVSKMAIKAGGYSCWNYDIDVRGQYGNITLSRNTENDATIKVRNNSDGEIKFYNEADLIR